MNKILFDLKVQQKPLNGCEFHLPFARFPHIRMHYTIFKKLKDLWPAGMKDACICRTIFFVTDPRSLVVLFTEDVNLVTKAIVSHIKVFNRKVFTHLFYQVFNSVIIEGRKCTTEPTNLWNLFISGSLFWLLLLQSKISDISEIFFSTVLNTDWKKK